MAAAAAKNIAKKSASYAQANPRLNKETNAIMVSSPTLASDACSPLCCLPHTGECARDQAGTPGLGSVLI